MNVTIVLVSLLAISFASQQNTNSVINSNFPNNVSGSQFSFKLQKHQGALKPRGKPAFKSSPKKRGRPKATVTATDREQKEIPEARKRRVIVIPSDANISEPRRRLPATLYTVNGYTLMLPNPFNYDTSQYRNKACGVCSGCLKDMENDEEEKA